VPLRTFCPRCTKTIQQLRSPRTMSLKQRVNEIRMWGDILEVPLHLYTARIDALVGSHVEWRDYARGTEHLVYLARIETDMGRMPLLGL
jgi:hypothetical protein